MATTEDARSNLEKLDDLQSTHPFTYNLVVGLLVGAAAWVVLRLHPVLVVAYAISYGGLRWYLWQDGRVLRRQYEARAVRWTEKRAAKRRQHG